MDIGLFVGYIGLFDVIPSYHLVIRVFRSSRWCLKRSLALLEWYGMDLVTDDTFNIRYDFFPSYDVCYLFSWVSDASPGLERLTIYKSR